MGGMRGIKIGIQVEIKMEEPRGAGGRIPSKRSAFGPWSRGSPLSVGRPLSFTRAATAGLEEMVTRIRRRESRADGGGQRSTSGALCLNDDSNGFLHLPGASVFAAGSLEQLGGRYEVLGVLGMGTFAQILEAEDMMSVASPRQRVALKVTRAGMQGIAMQESQLLAQLTSCKGFPGANIVRAHASFPFGDHWCMAMEAMHGYRSAPAPTSVVLLARPRLAPS